MLSAPGRACLTVAVGLLASGCSDSEYTPPVGEWSYFGGDKAFTRYSPLDQIDSTNVAGLAIAWRRPAVAPEILAANPDLNVPGYVRGTPIIVGDTLYLPNAHGFLEAVDPATGATYWTQEMGAGEELRGQSNRGVDIWSDGDTSRLIGVRGEFLFSIDRLTGRLSDGFGDEGGGRVLLRDRSDGLRFGWSSGPLVVGDVVVVAGTRGGAGDSGWMWRNRESSDVRGYDVRSGNHLWTFRAVPAENEFGTDTWGEESWRFSGDLGSWCCISGDEELGYVYVPFTAPTAAYYGGHRPGDNLFSNALVAIDTRTGKRVWHFQSVHHDLWEYDLIGPPTLGDIMVDGREIRAVMQPSKTGFLYVLDRVTGEPVWPIEERPVPQSTVPGEASALTQPFPTKPAPFDRQGITEDDLIDFTPELRARALEIVRDSFVLGPMFSPPGLVKTVGGPGAGLILPGSWGAGNWHTGAFDPETKIYYATSHTLPRAYRIEPATQEAAEMAYYSPDRTAPTIEGLPIVKPPYGRITAIDMNTGEHLWMVANGDGPRDHPLLAGLDPPPLGIASRPAALVTGTLLFVGEGADVFGGADGWGPMFRAYHKQSGEVAWEIELPAGTTGGPMTYMYGGKQYVVVSVGGQDHPGEWIALSLIP